MGCEDAVLFYPLYAVLFTDVGLSPAQVSSLFLIWSVTGLLCELPSGVWADVVPRRLLLTVAPLCSAVAFGMWTLWPRYPVFAAGFVLWGIGGALRSGTLQAHLYDQLAALGRSVDYARMVGRGEVVALVASVGATVAAAPVMAAGGYQAVGMASVAAHLAAALVGRSLPDRSRRDRVDGAGTAADPGEPGGDTVGGDEAARRPAVPDADTGGCGETGSAGGGVWAELAEVVRDGRARLRADVSVRRAVFAVAAVAGLATLDEYVPLLAADTGLDAAAVPMGVGVVTVGMALGGALAGRGAGRLGLILAMGAAGLAGGAGSARPVGLVGVAVAFGVLQWAMVVTDARLQERLGERSRATVTSLAGFGAELAAMVTIAGYALGSMWASSAVLFTVAAVPLAVAGLTALVAGRFRRPR